MTASDEDVDAVARVIYRAFDDASCAGREPTHDYDVMAECEFGGVSVLEGWLAAARAAIALGARARRDDSKARLEELLGLDSTNFLGTGLTFQQFMELYKAEQIARSWVLQPLEEKKRRRAAIIRLSAELERIRARENFATGLAEMAIEAVIEGDRKMVEEWAKHFAFEDERDEIRIHVGELYATFRELLLQVLRAEKEGPA